MPVVIVAGLLIGGFLVFVVNKVVEARRRPVRTGWEEMVGAEGEVRQAIDPVGQVFVRGRAVAGGAEARGRPDPGRR